MKDDNVCCPTPKCHGYANVYTLEERVPPSFMIDATHRCEECGGYFNGKEWKHVCGDCGKSVKAGELFGIFVPHLCKECQIHVEEVVSKFSKDFWGSHEGDCFDVRSEATITIESGESLEEMKKTYEEKDFYLVDVGIGFSPITFTSNKNAVKDHISKNGLILKLVAVYPNSYTIAMGYPKL